MTKWIRKIEMIEEVKKLFSQYRDGTITSEKLEFEIISMIGAIETEDS